MDIDIKYKDYIHIELIAALIRRTSTGIDRKIISILYV